MDAGFTFPRAQAPVPRPTPAHQAKGPSQSSTNTASSNSNSRESNALRASVLDAALELGIGNNSLVTNWMFNNTLAEEDEDQVSSPGLTNSSSAASEESTSSTSSKGPGVHFAPHVTIGPAVFPSGPASTPPGITSANGIIKSSFERDPNTVSFPSNDFELPAASFAIPIPPRPTTPGGGGAKRLLKKKTKSGDGYESDGGYLSEAAPGTTKKKKEKKEKIDKEEDKERKKVEKEEEKERKRAEKEEKKTEKAEKAEEEKEERKRKKSLVDAVRPRKKDKGGEESFAALAGYDTDGDGISKPKAMKPKKAKSKSKDKDGGEGGYETDGYQSSSGVKKSKSRFFKLSSKSSRTDLAAKDDAEAVPPLPFQLPMPLPIAERFATTLAADSSVANLSLGGSPTGSSPGSGSGGPQMPQFSFQPLGVNGSAPSPTRPIPSLPHEGSSSSIPSSLRPDSLMSTGSSSSGGSHGRKGAVAGLNISAMGLASPVSPLDSANASGHSHSYGFGQSGSSHGHSPGYGGGVGGSSSTITSMSAASLSQQSHAPSASASSATSSGSAGLRPPMISLPNTRSPSPSQPPLKVQTNVSPPSTLNTSPKSFSPSPVSPMQVNRAGFGLRIKPSLEKLNLLSPPSRNNGMSPGPSPISPGSPYVMVDTPTGMKSSMSSPALSSNPYPPPTQGLPPALQGFRSRNGVSPSPSPHPHSYISPPNTAAASAAASRSASPNPHAQYLSVIPSSDFLVPSPSAATMGVAGNSTPRRAPSPMQLHSPNVLAYYDVPPPSPPPMGPLPSVPGAPPESQAHTKSASQPARNHSQSPPQGQFPSPAQLRQRMMDRTPRQLPPDGFAGIQRGKESPFPATARRYANLYPATAPTRMSVAGADEEDELERSQREEKQRRRAITAVRNGSAPNDFENRRRPSEESSSGEGWPSAGRNRSPGASEEVADSSGMRDVLDRFENESSESAESAYSSKEPAVGRSRAAEALRLQEADKERLQALIAAAGANRESEYVFEGEDRTVGDRTSRWSGSIYSRASILDEDESGSARDRFVKRVEAMLDEEGLNTGGGSGSGGVGRGVGRGYIPPVPRLPEAYARARTNGAQSEGSAGPRNWNKF